MPGRAFQKLLMVVGVASLLLTGAAESEDVETRIFSGSGSRSVTSDVELFVGGGTYEHQLETPGCLATAGLFPSERLPTVKLREVLSADLSTGSIGSSLRRTMPSGTFTITTPGWATLQVGTGPDCSWTYSVRGRFLPSGDEPAPPRDPGLQWWEWGLLFIAVAAAVALVARRGFSVRDPDMAEPRVRTLASTSDQDP